MPGDGDFFEYTGAEGALQCFGLKQLYARLITSYFVVLIPHICATVHCCQVIAVFL